jgi:hypothetical protein
MERRTDMYVSTLAGFIKAMGGELEMRANFPEGPVRISGIAEVRPAGGSVHRATHATASTWAKRVAKPLSYAGRAGMPAKAEYATQGRARRQSMNYSKYKIKFLHAKADLERDIDRIFPGPPPNKRKECFRLMMEMEEKDLTVGNWLRRVAAAGHERVEVDYITACYMIDEPNRYVWKLVDLVDPTTGAAVSK